MWVWGGGYGGERIRTLPWLVQSMPHRTSGPKQAGSKNWGSLWADSSIRIIAFGVYIVVLYMWELTYKHRHR